MLLCPVVLAMLVKENPVPISSIPGLGNLDSVEVKAIPGSETLDAHSNSPSVI